MYLIEWGWWRMQKTPACKRKQPSAYTTQRKLQNNFYESDFDEEIHFHSTSDNPQAYGPIYSLNDTYMEMRCGASEEKRGLITLMTIAGIGPIFYTSITITFGSIYRDILDPQHISPLTAFITLLMAMIDVAIAYLYMKYGVQITRLEILTSRNLLIRFNRITQQVHLHRPSYCGGMVTFPWRATGSTATYPEDDSTSIGIRLGLLWHPSRTGLPHMEMAMLGKQGQGGSELRDQWEFIRRYMEEGPDSIPRPRLSTQLPSPIQAFSAQFEGMGRFFRNSSWQLKVILLLVWPAFVILGTAHWVSLMLCWRPRWPKVIREAGMPGKPVPPLTTLADYPPEVQERLLANADRWQLKPGKRPEKRPRSPRTPKEKNAEDNV